MHANVKQMIVIHLAHTHILHNVHRQKF